MITLIIGSREQSEKEVAKIIKDKPVFVVNSIFHHLKDIEEEVRKRGLLLIKNLDHEALFELIISSLERLKNENIETIAITYRDDIIEVYEEDEDVNIIDLRGE